MPTIEELQAQAQQYLQEHPELTEVLRQFQDAWRQYQQYLVVTTISQVRSDSTPANRGAYHANVSRPSERYQ
jgi:hypothetical protein